MKKIIYIFGILLIICAISMYFTDDKSEESYTDKDLRIWFPSGYEIMKKKDMNDITVIKEIENRLEIPLYFKNVSGDIDSSFQAQMSDLSNVDMLYYKFDQGMITSALKNDLLYEYTKDLDKMPHLKKQFELHPELYKKACPNHQCVVFPGTKEHTFKNIVIAYRSDWAKQAGYDEIKNLDEYTDMMKKQKRLFDQHELKNQGDYFLGLSSYHSFINEFMNFFDTTDALYYKNNQLVYGPATEEYRSYLIYLKSLFKEKLLDPRIYEASEVDMEKFFLNSQSSSILTTYEHAKKLEEYAKANKDNIPLSYIYLYTLDQDYENRSIYDIKDRSYQVLDYGYVMKSHIDEEKRNNALRFIDYLYSDEGMTLYNYGIKDIHYEEKDRQKKYKKEIAEENEYYAISISPYVKQDLLRIDQRSDFAMLDKQLQKQIKETQYKTDQSFMKPVGYYTDEERELINQIEVSLDTFVQETSMNFIFKDIDPANEENWQDYMNGLNHMGLQQYIDIQIKAAEKSK